MSNLPNSSMIAVALGAAIGVLGAATVIIYQKIVERKQRTRMNECTQNLDSRIADLEAELRRYKNQQRIRKSRGIAAGKSKGSRGAEGYGTATEDDISIAETDAVSIADTYSTADDDDEFYDCSDEEYDDGEDTNENGTSGAMGESMRRRFEVLDKIDQVAEESLRPPEEALRELTSMIESHPGSVEVIWRFARACFKCADRITDATRSDELRVEGIKTCEPFLNNAYADLHKWYALLVGSRAEYLPIGERVESGVRFEKHVKIALESNPKDATLHYLMGRFKYSVAGLNWFERKISATMFGEVPPGTYEEAIEHLEESERLSDKPDVEYKYYLGMAHMNAGSYKKGLEALRAVDGIRARGETQEKLKKEAKEAIARYSSYA